MQELKGLIYGNITLTPNPSPTKLERGTVAADRLIHLILERNLGYTSTF